MEEKLLYKPFKSKVKNKKFSVYVMIAGKKRKINFGDTRYRHNYSKKARQNYLARARGIRNKKGRLTYKDKNTANYWSINYLWK